MKAYTLCILAKLSGKDEMAGQTEGDDIVIWVNNKVLVMPVNVDDDDDDDNQNNDE